MITCLQLVCNCFAVFLVDIIDFAGWWILAFFLFNLILRWYSFCNASKLQSITNTTDVVNSTNMQTEGWTRPSQFDNHIK